MIMEESPIKGSCAQGSRDRQLDGILSPGGGSSHFWAVSGEKGGRGVCGSAVLSLNWHRNHRQGFLTQVTGPTSRVSESGGLELV